MIKISRIKTSVLFFIVALLSAFGMPGCSVSNSGGVSADTPVLFGPPGSRFWTTYANAVVLSGKPVVYCTTVHSDHQIGTAEDSFQNRYMSAEKEGDTVELRMVAKADTKYEHVDGMQMLFHQYPVEDAPWVAKTYSAFFMRNGNGEIRKVGQVDSQYREFGGRQGLMTKGASDGELWTGDANGGIYRLQGDGQAVMVGSYDRRWVTPAGAKERLILPLMMSRSAAENSPWIGELGGVIYVEDAGAANKT